MSFRAGCFRAAALTFLRFNGETDGVNPNLLTSHLSPNNLLPLLHETDCSSRPVPDLACRLGVAPLSGVFRRRRGIRPGRARCQRDAKAASRTRTSAGHVGDLNLSPEQKEKLMPLLMSEMERLAALRADESLRPRQKLQRMKALRDELTPRVKAILTPEQFIQWEKKRAEVRDELRGKLRDRQG